MNDTLVFEGTKLVRKDRKSDAKLQQELRSVRRARARARSQLASIGDQRRDLLRANNQRGLDSLDKMETLVLRLIERADVMEEDALAQIAALEAAASASRLGAEKPPYQSPLRR
ncbi:hypothetical protein AZA_26634 [Nitrospirillum viridazoti Y2]|uniref:Uncharacterized protein n=1 Tax=Nitrospirillum amazonense TaxID=28077 RepID=A0A560IVQ7_9PROT|nr:hypothetical protein [Nitrospirillum amazonense]EGX99728.1 hypothetical protein AZA_26634 [Nitrospirillum amazonense Y2]TWB62239.1 hypothetical protein FBZ92_105174 [Nitrospirillum amazonense]